LVCGRCGCDWPERRYPQAEHDDIDELLARVDELRERDLNAIRSGDDPEH
jgi:hypothetical protein